MLAANLQIPRPSSSPSKNEEPSNLSMSLHLGTEKDRGGPGSQTLLLLKSWLTLTLEQLCNNHPLEQWPRSTHVPICFLCFSSPLRTLLTHVFHGDCWLLCDSGFVWKSPLVFILVYMSALFKQCLQLSCMLQRQPHEESTPPSAFSVHPVFMAERAGQSQQELISLPRQEHFVQEILLIKALSLLKDQTSPNVLCLYLSEALIRVIFGRTRAIF